MEKVETYLGDRAVEVLEVGWVRTKVRATWNERRETLLVNNRQLTPEPCGICKGTGKLGCMLGSCWACGGRGHSPGRNSSVMKVVHVVEAGVEAGLTRAEREHAQAEHVAVRRVERLPEPESFTLCAECLVHPCECEEE